VSTADGAIAADYLGGVVLESGGGGVELGLVD
jgi:hypothetical protein